FTLGSSYNDGGTGLGAPTLDATAGTFTFNSTPTAAGTVTFTVNVTDTAGATLSQPYSITINNGPSLGTLTPTQWTFGQGSYPGDIPITGIGPFTITNQSGLPDGLTAVISNNGSGS